VRIVVEKLEVWYNSMPALRDVSFEVDGGEMVFVIGPNGAGKSTLLKTIASIVKPRSGAIYIDGKILLRHSPRDLGKLIAYVDPQVNRSIFSTVLEFLLTARYPHQNTLSFSVPRQDLEIVEKVSKQLSIDHLLNRRLDQLSGGELQRVLLARAFVQRPRVLLLDEPSAFLDLKYRLEILDCVKRNVKANRIACLVAVHDLYLASLYADKVVVMNGGEIVAAGAKEEVLRKDLLEKIYQVKISLLDVGGRRIVIPLEPIERIEREGLL
jgi:iron complex transport system ATP-binding protein